MPTKGPDSQAPGAWKLSHEAARAMLPEYATAAALGSQPEETDPALDDHIRRCDVCRAELEELTTLAKHAFSGRLDPADDYPNFDLSFIKPAPEARASYPWFLDQLGRLIVTFSEELLAGLRQPTLAGAPRGQLLYRYTQEPGPARNLELSIEVFTEDTARTTARVQVIVDVPDYGALDQSGSQVTLRYGEASCSGETDDSGCVDFKRIPLDALPNLRVEVAPKQG